MCVCVCVCYSTEDAWVTSLSEGASVYLVTYSPSVSLSQWFFWLDFGYFITISLGYMFVLTEKFYF